MAAVTEFGPYRPTSSFTMCAAVVALGSSGLLIFNNWTTGNGAKWSQKALNQNLTRFTAKGSAEGETKTQS